MQCSGLTSRQSPCVTRRSTGRERTVIPYAAILYDTQGNTWTYINSEPLTFVRHPITVDDIEGDEAFLSDGHLRAAPS